LTPAATPAAAMRPADIGPLLAELDDLTERAASLRLRLAQMGQTAPRRPGWPISRVGLPAQDRG
jgi:hypothetical protein